MAIKKSTPTPKPTPPPVIAKSWNRSSQKWELNPKPIASYQQEIQAKKTASTPAGKTTGSNFIPSNYGVGAGRTATGATNVIGKTDRPKQEKDLINILGGGGGGTTKFMTPDQLYVDPTPAYQPVLDYLNQQGTAAKDRYAVNAANIKNVFSALTGLTAADSVRITKQFTDSLTASKADLASRTAEARAGSAAGTAQAAVTGAERGGGPEMAVNPIQVAAEEGIARSNEYATTWQALQQANQQQAMTDISARGAGYGQQEVGAIQQLAQNLEDRLLAIGGNTAQVQSDIAQAKFSQEKEIQGVKFQLSEQAKQAAQAAAAAASRAPSYSRDSYGLAKRMSDSGLDFNTVANGLTEAYGAVYDELNPNAGLPGARFVEPKKAQILQAWTRLNGDAQEAPFVYQIADLWY
jgi:hypothetical protein